MGGAEGVLTDGAVKYLSSHSLHANYVNLKIPETTSLVVSTHKRSADYYDLSKEAVAIVEFYQCQKINPDRKLGAVKENTIGIGAGAGANPSDMDVSI